MKQQEYKAYANPFHVLMFAGDRHGALARPGLDVPGEEFSGQRDGVVRSEPSLEVWQESVENALLSAVSAYYQLVTSVSAKLRLSDSNGDAQAFTQVVFQLRCLNKMLADRPYVGGQHFSSADETALCALNFARSVNISLPIDCIALRRWYASVSERPSSRCGGSYEA